MFTWKSASNDLTVKTNRTLTFCPGSVLDGVVKSYMNGHHGSQLDLLPLNPDLYC